jgi:two-component system sensor histidine kinase DegS
MDNQQVAVDPKEELLAIIKERMTQVKRKMTELKAQIEQMKTAVDREQQRYSDLNSDIRTLKDNIDTVPRQDILSKYDETLESRFRLATMSGQFEKFQASYESMEQEQMLLSQLYGKLEGVDALGAVEEELDTPAKASANIVRIVQAQEEERQRLARQLHDGPAQSLTNFILQAEICQRLFNRNPERAEEELNNLKTTASVTFQKVRDFIFDLRPMMLDDLGVVPTVRRYIDSFKDKTDIDTTPEIMGEERRLETYREVMIFRAIQDLMGHVRDYAGANQLKVRLDMSGSRIKVQVDDNGKGFDAAAIFTSEESHLDARSQGILTLKQKFELVGGTVAVTSDENAGTTVRVELPAGDEGA